MNSMSFLVWFLPVIFMIHDFEEIIMAEVWGTRFNEKIQQFFRDRHPFGIGKNYAWYTPVLSIAVASEFLVFTAICYFSYVYQNYFIWFSAFLGLIIHMVFIHIAVCPLFKGYVPGVVTSIVLLLPSILVLVSANDLLKFDSETLLFASILGTALLAILLPALHGFMRVTDRWLDSYSKKDV